MKIKQLVEAKKKEEAAIDFAALSTNKDKFHALWKIKRANDSFTQIGPQIVKRILADFSEDQFKIILKVGVESILSGKHFMWQSDIFEYNEGDNALKAMKKVGEGINGIFEKSPITVDYDEARAFQKVVNEFLSIADKYKLMSKAIADVVSGIEVVIADKMGLSNREWQMVTSDEYKEELKKFIKRELKIK